jgi:hypothetical protein
MGRAKRKKLERRRQRQSEGTSSASSSNRFSSASALPACPPGQVRSRFVQYQEKARQRYSRLFQSSDEAGSFHAEQHTFDVRDYTVTADVLLDHARIPEDFFPTNPVWIEYDKPRTPIEGAPLTIEAMWFYCLPLDEQTDRNTNFISAPPTSSDRQQARPEGLYRLEVIDGNLDLLYVAHYIRSTQQWYWPPENEQRCPSQHHLHKADETRSQVKCEACDALLEIFTRLFTTSLLQTRGYFSTTREPVRETPSIHRSLVQEKRADHRQRVPLFLEYYRTALKKKRDLVLAQTGEGSPKASLAQATWSLLSLTLDNALISQLDQSALAMIEDHMTDKRSQLPGEAFLPVVPDRAVWIEMEEALYQDLLPFGIKAILLSCVRDDRIIEQALALVPDQARKQIKRIAAEGREGIWRLEVIDEEASCRFVCEYKPGMHWQLTGYHECPWQSCQERMQGGEVMIHACERCIAFSHGMALFVGVALLMNMGYFQRVRISEKTVQVTRRRFVNASKEQQEGGVEKRRTETEAETQIVEHTYRFITVDASEQEVPLIKEPKNRSGTGARTHWLQLYDPDEIAYQEKVPRKHDRHYRDEVGRITKVVPVFPKQKRSYPYLKEHARVVKRIGARRYRRERQWQERLTPEQSVSQPLPTNRCYILILQSGVTPEGVLLAWPSKWLADRRTTNLQSWSKDMADAANNRYWMRLVLVAGEELSEQQRTFLETSEMIFDYGLNTHNYTWEFVSARRPGKEMEGK